MDCKFHSLTLYQVCKALLVPRDIHCGQKKYAERRRANAENSKARFSVVSNASPAAGPGEKVARGGGSGNINNLEKHGERVRQYRVYKTF